jgi:hypothetical protein
MASTWEHPDLGRFEFIRTPPLWAGLLDVPAFSAFTYNSKEPTEQYGLWFYADDENDLPSEAAVAVALKVQSNQTELASKIVKALWDDFNGLRSHSGMWWHGRLQHVRILLLDDEPLAGPRDLLPLLRLDSIAIQKDLHGYDKPIGLLAFRAPFEPEHGVGILTDGSSVDSIGYFTDFL